jgi:hypothetical protein
MSKKKTSTKLTYRELRAFLQTVPDERLDDNVTVYDFVADEVYPVDRVCSAPKSQDILDEGHVVMTFNS